MPICSDWIMFSLAYDKFESFCLEICKFVLAITDMSQYIKVKLSYTQFFSIYNTSYNGLANWIWLNIKVVVLYNEFGNNKYSIIFLLPNAFHFFDNFFNFFLFEFKA